MWGASVSCEEASWATDGDGGRVGKIGHKYETKIKNGSKGLIYSSCHCHHHIVGGVTSWLECVGHKSDGITYTDGMTRRFCRNGNSVKGRQSLMRHSSSERTRAGVIRRSDGVTSQHRHQSETSFVINAQHWLMPERVHASTMSTLNLREGGGLNGPQRWHYF